ncbi:MAG TPA: zinc-binding dehydrogenase [Ktedonobacterales bacterium]|jgi:NADPH:quinone reductase-like Zn-dependent oxidoreductase|nr:zinc-binding dehydrogenase [Ktedonobacterales bacterium]
MTNAKMPAAVIVRHAVPPEHQHYPIPSRRAGQALIRVTAAPISPLDLLCASGRSYFGPPQLPYIPGVQGVGTVMEADALVPGQRVWFSCDAGMKAGDGSMAAYCVADESALLTLPDNVPDDLVAALGLSAIAAWMALTWRGQLQSGEQVLVLGASGAVGQVAVQAAKLLGAGRVIAASRDQAALARALTRGADATVDLTGDDVDDLHRRMVAASEGPLHLVIDPVWGLPAEAAARTLGMGGRLVNIGSASGPTARFESATVRSRLHNILGYTNNALTQQQKAQALSTILAYAAAGRCTVDRETMPLARAAEAWELQSAFARRKLILIP